MTSHSLLPPNDLVHSPRNSLNLLCSDPIMLLSWFRWDELTWTWSLLLQWLALQPLLFQTLRAATAPPVEPAWVDDHDGQCFAWSAGGCMPRRASFTDLLDEVQKCIVFEVFCLVVNVQHFVYKMALLPRFFLNLHRLGNQSHRHLHAIPSLSIPSYSITIILPHQSRLSPLQIQHYPHFISCLIDKTDHAISMATQTSSMSQSTNLKPIDRHLTRVCETDSSPRHARHPEIVRPKKPLNLALPPTSTKTYLRPPFSRPQMASEGGDHSRSSISPVSSSSPENLRYTIPSLSRGSQRHPEGESTFHPRGMSTEGQEPSLFSQQTAFKHTLWANGDPIVSNYALKYSY